MTEDKNMSENALSEESPPAALDETEPKGLTAVETAPDNAAEIENLRRVRDDLTEQLLRKRAEFENYRKRVDRDRQQIGLDAQAEFITGLTQTLDNLDHALRADTTYETLREGVLLIQRDFLSYLTSLGLAVHDPTGQPFNPLTDQALSHEHVPGYDDGIVVECFRKGYFFRDRLLRPALVRVARGEAMEHEDESGKDNDEDHAPRVSH